MTKQELIQQLSETVEQHYSRAHLAVTVGKFELVFFKGVSWIAKLDPLFKLIQLTSVAQDMDTFIPGRVKRDPRHRFIAGVIRRLDNHKVIGAVVAVWKLWQENTAYIPAIWIDRPYRGTKVSIQFCPDQTELV